MTESDFPTHIQIPAGDPLVAKLPPLSAQGPPMEITSAPLSCNVSSGDVYRMLDGYFEGIDVGRRQTLSNHVEACDCCADVVQFQLGLRSVIGSGCREELPADVRQRLLDSLHNLF